MRISAISFGVGLGLVGLLGCRANEPHPVAPSPPGAIAPAPVAQTASARRARLPAIVTLSIVGTSDLHGHVLSEQGKGGLDVFAGYLANLRAARKADQGGVVLVDGGDLFQGTLESNLGEGAVVIEMYNALGYTAATIGNHEFDFGPVGDAATPSTPADDPRGALKARIAEAKFPFIASNLVEAASGAAIAWPNVKTGAVVKVAGVKVGLIGVTTLATARTTMAANFAGLQVTPLTEAITREAAALRQQGAKVVVVMAHEGGKCASFADPRVTDSCDPSEEIMPILAQVPPGTVDAVVGGHTHQAMAHFVNGTPVVQSWANGRGFGRIDLKVDRKAGKVIETRIFPPEEMAAGKLYEGAPVTADPVVAALAADDVERARSRQEQPLGVSFADSIDRSYDSESEEGNLFADMMLAALPGTDVALTNGGGLRADLPAGALTYGRLYQAYPFDNRFARVRLTGKQLRAMVAENLKKPGGILSLAGVRATATCKGGVIEVKLRRASGKLVGDSDTLVVVTSDFLATGGDKTFAKLPDGAVEIVDAPLIRDGIGSALAKRGGTLHGRDFFDPKKPRLAFPGQRPLTCAH